MAAVVTPRPAPATGQALGRRLEHVGTHRPSMRAVPFPQQRLLVMPDDGAAAVVELIDAASECLLLKQFKLQSEVVLQALRRAHQRGVEVRVMLNPHTSGGDRWNDEAY
ncbi:MAG: hypothetical protein ACO23C_11000, partial [Prochlorococcaceae cyanobacterium]